MSSIPDGHRPVDYIMSMVHGGQPESPIASLEAARQTENAVVILDGDYGGQVYASCPVKYLRDITLSELEQLCRSVSAIEWGDTQAADNDWSVTLCVKEIGSGIWGGMGGGMVIDGLWLHSDLAEASSALIKSILK